MCAGPASDLYVVTGATRQVWTHNKISRLSDFASAAVVVSLLQAQ